MKIIEFLLSLLNFIFPDGEKMWLLDQRESHKHGVKNVEEAVDIIYSKNRKCGTIANKNIGADFHSVFSYKDPLIKKMIYRMKFGNSKWCARLCGEIIQREIQKHAVNKPAARDDVNVRAEMPGNLLKNSLLTPIPIHRRRRNERGFNQCERICEEIKNKTGIPHEPKLLIRKIYRDKQSWSNKEERQEKIRGVFKINKKVLQKIQQTRPGRTILLIDDVITTGSTVREAEKELREAGLGDVRVFSVAH